jgi:hypothetical protein
MPGVTAASRVFQVCTRTVLICLIVASPPVALSEEIDEGEFSQATLGYKLQLLRDQFEQTETKLSTRSVAGSTLKKLEHVYSEMKRLEAEFRCGKYYPDLLDEQIVIMRKESLRIRSRYLYVGTRLSLAWINPGIG